MGGWRARSHRCGSVPRRSVNGWHARSPSSWTPRSPCSASSSRCSCWPRRCRVPPGGCRPCSRWRAGPCGRCSSVSSCCASRSRRRSAPSSVGAGGSSCSSPCRSSGSFVWRGSGGWSVPGGSAGSCRHRCAARARRVAGSVGGWRGWPPSRPSSCSAPPRSCSRSRPTTPIPPRSGPRRWRRWRVSPSPCTALPSCWRWRSCCSRSWCSPPWRAASVRSSSSGLLLADRWPRLVPRTAGRPPVATAPTAVVRAPAPRAPGAPLDRHRRDAWWSRATTWRAASCRYPGGAPGRTTPAS